MKTHFHSDFSFFKNRHAIHPLKNSVNSATSQVTSSICLTFI